MKVTPRPPNLSLRPHGIGRKGGENAVARAVVDTAEVAGIPAAELTPRVQEVMSSLMKEVADLRGQLDEARAHIGVLETLAKTDPLLGILNRRAFVDELDRAISTVDRYKIPSSLLFIDLDGLKQVNDKNGHGFGDQVLKAVSNSIAQQIRQTDVFGRLGGDEFAVILMHSELPSAERKAVQIRKTVADLDISIEGKTTKASISVGAVELGAKTTAGAAIERADKKMYLQKRQLSGA